MQVLPTGTITFLFTDIEGSTRLWQDHPEQMQANLARHDAGLRAAIQENGGYVFKTVGDAFCAAFPTALQGVKAAIQAQQALAGQDWGPAAIKVRMGLHTGDAEERDSDYFGNTLNRVARLMSAGHGGQTLLSRATQELVRDKLPAGVTLTDLGERSLKDLTRPEHVYQLNVPGLPGAFEPLKTLDAYRHNLPTQVSSFIGREKEMAEIKQALEGHRLVTLTGPGGTGKTRLSLQVAADLLDRFPGGTWFVELASLGDPDLIPQAILGAAEMQTLPGRTALESLSDFLREKSCLLVLDNCEHLVEACARLAGLLLRTAPNLSIFASSREALGVPGELSWRVSSLSVPDLEHLPPLGQLSQYEAVRLFIDRALLVQPHFAVTNQNAPAVAQICARLDGIPLAIELAAARIRMLSAEQIAVRLDDRFRLLTGGSRTALPHQQTLRALIDWSYDLLSERERTLLQRLAVFVSGWTLEAAEQVCAEAPIAAADVMDWMARLVDKSLVSVKEGREDNRYSMLETVRQYAWEKLSGTGDHEKIRARHLAYFLELAEEARPYLARTEQITWLDRLDQEASNLRAALEWALDGRPPALPEAGLRLANALRPFWYLRGYWREGHEWLARVLAAHPSPIPSAAWAGALVTAAYFEIDNSKRVIQLCDESIAVSRALGDKPCLAEAILLKAIHTQSDVAKPEKRALLEECLGLFRDLEDKRNIAIALYHFGMIAWSDYDFPAERRYVEECLELSREVGDRRFTAIALMTLGSLFEIQGDLPTARLMFEESLASGRELGDRHGLVMYLRSLGATALEQGDYLQAGQHLSESLDIARELGSKTEMANTLVYLGLFARRQGDYDQALKLLKEVLSISAEVSDRFVISPALCALGELSRLKGDFSSARSFYIEAVALAREIDDRETLAHALEEIAALSAAQGRARQAATLFGAAAATRAAIHVALFPAARAELEGSIAVARAGLEEVVFDAAYAQGQAMPLEQALELALHGANQS